MIKPCLIRVNIFVLNSKGNEHTMIVTRAGTRTMVRNKQEAAYKTPRPRTRRERDKKHQLETQEPSVQQLYRKWDRSLLGYLPAKWPLSIFHATRPVWDRSLQCDVTRQRLLQTGVMVYALRQRTVTRCNTHFEGLGYWWCGS